jgi:hypothetical protein
MKKHGWGNAPKIIRIDRVDEDGFLDDGVSYKLYHCTDAQQVMSNYSCSDFLTSSWLEILLTTGFTKTMIMTYLKRGFDNGFHSITDFI